MPVLPVTKTWLDRDVLADEVLQVGRGRREVQRGDAGDDLAVELLGNGERLLPPVRSPASTCITGMRRWKAASAAAIAELVSPWTRTAAGQRPSSSLLGLGRCRRGPPKHSTQKSSKRRITEATRSFSSLARPRPRASRPW